MGDETGVSVRSGKYRIRPSHMTVTLPIGLLLAAVAVAWGGNEATVTWLGRYFITKAEGQTLGERVAGVESGIKGLASKLDARAIEDLEGKIFEVRLSECMAIGQLRTAYAKQRTDLVGKWRMLTGQYQSNPPTLLDCEDIGK